MNPQSSEKWEFMTERGRGVGRERPKKRNEEERGHIVGKGQGVGRSQERGPVVGEGSEGWEKGVLTGWAA